MLLRVPGVGAGRVRGIEGTQRRGPLASVAVEVGVLTLAGQLRRSDLGAVDRGDQARGVAEVVGRVHERERVGLAGRQRAGQIVFAVDGAGTRDEPALRAGLAGRRLVGNAGGGSRRGQQADRIVQNRTSTRRDPGQLVGTGLGGQADPVPAGLAGHVDEVGLGVGEEGGCLLREGGSSPRVGGGRRPGGISVAVDVQGELVADPRIGGIPFVMAGERLQFPGVAPAVGVPRRWLQQPDLVAVLAGGVRVHGRGGTVEGVDLLAQDATPEGPARFTEVFGTGACRKDRSAHMRGLGVELVILAGQVPGDVGAVEVGAGVIPGARRGRVKNTQQRHVLVLSRPFGQFDHRRGAVEHLAAAIKYEVIVGSHESECDRQEILVSLSDPAIPSPPRLTSVGFRLSAKARYSSQNGSEGPLPTPPRLIIEWDKSCLRVIWG